MSGSEDSPSLAPSRRSLASGVFPAIHAQEKIVLRYLGTAVNQDKTIAENSKPTPALKSSTWRSPPTT